MGRENIKCFECNDYGHLAADCPERIFAAELGNGKPPWCRQPQCDAETRLVYTQTADGLKAHRCYQCHPKSQSMPVQFRRCKRCRAVTYEWDQRSECNSHLPVGKQLQVAESFQPAKTKTGAKAK